MRAFVTGATGVVGGNLLRHLVGEGDSVTAYTRRPVDLGSDVEVVVGSLHSHRRLWSAMQGHDVVFHVAGINELCTSNAGRMYHVNVEGTRTVLSAAAAAGVERVVHTSSVAVTAEPSPSHYSRSKRLAEELVLAQDEIDVVVVRPASVQGPGRASGSTRMIIDIVTGRLPFAVDTTFSVVDVDDCSVGHRAAAVAGRPGGVYTLSGFSTSVSDALAMVERALGHGVRVRYVPLGLFSAVGSLAELVRLWGGTPRVCRELVRTLRLEHRHDGTAAATEFGFRYRTAEETVQRLIDWLRQMDIID